MSRAAGRHAVSRRGLLVGASALALGTAAACSTSGETTSSAKESTGRTLLTYFSRAGENYHGGHRKFEVGTTEVVARMIADLIDCDVHRIEAADAYPARTRQPCSATAVSNATTSARRSRIRSTRSRGATPS